MMNDIVLENVCKKYRSSDYFALDNIDLKIGKGTVFGLLGPNGAGKTTLISILCGILEPTSGAVSFFQNGISVSSKDTKPVLGFVPQDFAFYQELTPRQNLDYFGAMYNLADPVLKHRAKELLAVLGLEKYADKKVETFSGGMKRRVNLAIGIIHQPTILFLDEPTVGVDVQSKTAILKYLTKLNESGTTIIYTSHHLTEAESFCKEIALIDHGKIVAHGETQLLLKRNRAENLESLFIELTGEDFRDK